ncbi:hypothetical protein [Marinimicrobium alkaliphilum]|uniref:hypothetical protein n=1 Tax=Marinimicrobium alkaliphilum TaxID=2202654 RepID=UPI000DBA799F|nr:hypothetical protein [Marinimicrobium alkaliphilum]
MEVADSLFVVMLTLSAMIFSVVPFAFILWYALHLVLSPRLDPLLFKDPYFTRSEQVSYQCFPLSFLKSGNYVYLLVAPSLAKKRRFKGLSEPVPVGRVMRIVCVVQLSLMCLGSLVGILWFLLMGYAAFVVLL